MQEQAEKWFSKNKKFSIIYYAIDKDMYIQESVVEQFLDCDLYEFKKEKIKKNKYMISVKKHDKGLEKHLEEKEKKEKVEEVKKTTEPKTKSSNKKTKK
jgi:hypothetical protein